MALLRSLLHLVLVMAVLAQSALAERVGCCCATNRKAELSQRIAQSSPQEEMVAASCPRCRAKLDRQTEQREQSQGQLQKVCRCISTIAPAVIQDRQAAAFEMPAKTRAENVSFYLPSHSRTEVVLSESSGVKLTGRELRVWHCSWLA